MNAAPHATRRIVFYDDARARTFEPFAMSRPFCEMRVGALLVRERWELALDASSAGFISSAHLTGFVEDGAPRSVSGVLRAGTIVVNARAAVSLRDDVLVQLRDEREMSKQRSWFVDDKLAAFELTDDIDVQRLRDGSSTLEQLAIAGRPNETHASGRIDVAGVWIDEVWDVVRHLNTLLGSDVEFLAMSRGTSQIVGGCTAPVVLGAGAVYVENGATVEPMVVFDTTNGPIYLSSGSTVQAFTRVVGPCYVGRNSVLMGERISGSSIGDTCRVHGELSASVFLGYANKGHDGFVGHSIVGRWVNMGAGTITSNLKNTYGTVALWTPGGVRDTKLQFLGTLFGDHVKTGIGMRLTTGCVLGMAANVFDSMTPKVVEPFAWGSGAPYSTYAVDKFIETAERMMSRRHVDLNDEGRAMLRSIHAARWHTT